MTPFRVYLIHRHFHKKKVPPSPVNPKGETEGLEILLTPIKGESGAYRVISAESAEKAFTVARFLFPTFHGRLCIGPLPTLHQRIPHDNPSPEVE